MNGLHNAVQRVLERCSRRIRTVVRTDHEPTATDLLGGAYPEDDVRALFPCTHRLSKRLRKQTLDLREAYERARIAPINERPQRMSAIHTELNRHRDEVIRELCTSSSGPRPDAAGIRIARANKGVRPDLAISVEVTTASGDLSRRQLWVDVSGTHSTTNNTIRMMTTLSHIRRMLSGNRSRLKSTFTTGLNRADSAKRTKFAALLKAAKHLDQDTTFQPFAFTMQGILSEGAHRVLDFICAAKKAEVATQPRRRDALTPTYVVKDADRRLRDELAASISRGWGGILRSAGRPLPSGRTRGSRHYNMN